MKFDKIKNYIIIFLTIIVFSLGYFIFTGKFCHCSTVKCPVDTQARRFFA